MTGAVALAAIASACSTSDRTPIVRTQIVEREVPAEALKPCPAPKVLPDRDMTETETQTYWGADRTALRVCETRRAAAVAGGPHVQ